MPLFYILLTLISLIYYMYVPTTYSLVMCTVITLVYTAATVCFLHVMGKNNIFNFYTLFLISILFTSFMLPVLNVDNMSLLHKLDLINDDVINKSSAISLVGSLAFMSGSLVTDRYLLKKVQCHANISSDALNYKLAINILLILSYSLLAIFFKVGGIDYLHIYSGKAEINTTALTILDIFKIVFIVLSIYVFKELKQRQVRSFIDTFLKANKYYVCLYLILVVFLMLGGTRNLPVQLTLIIIGAYSVMIRGLSNKHLVILVFSGMIFLSLIRVGRGGGQEGSIVSSGIQNFEMEGITDVSLDLLLASLPLYALVEHADTNGISYGQSMLMPFLSLLPFAQNVYVSTFDPNMDELSPTSLLATDILYGSRDVGAGSNIMGDIYYAFSIYGVLILMALLGYIVTYYSYNASKNQETASLIIYIGLLSVSLFYARAELTYVFRYIIWALLLSKVMSLVAIKSSSAIQHKCRITCN